MPAGRAPPGVVDVTRLRLLPALLAGLLGKCGQVHAICSFDGKCATDQGGELCMAHLRTDQEAGLVLGKSERCSCVSQLNARYARRHVLELISVSAFVAVHLDRG